MIDSALLGSQIAFDPSVGAVYVTFPTDNGDRAAVSSIEIVTDEVIVDLDIDGQPIGVELVNLGYDAWADLVTRRFELDDNAQRVLAVAHALTATFRRVWSDPDSVALADVTLAQVLDEEPTPA